MYVKKKRLSHSRRHPLVRLRNIFRHRVFSMYSISRSICWLLSCPVFNVSVRRTVLSLVHSSFKIEFCTFDEESKERLSTFTPSFLLRDSSKRFVGRFQARPFSNVKHFLVLAPKQVRIKSTRVFRNCDFFSYYIDLSKTCICQFVLKNWFVLRMFLCFIVYFLYFIVSVHNLGILLFSLSAISLASIIIFGGKLDEFRKIYDRNLLIRPSFEIKAFQSLQFYRFYNLQIFL